MFAVDKRCEIGTFAGILHCPIYWQGNGLTLCVRDFLSSPTFSFVATSAIWIDSLEQSARRTSTTSHISSAQTVHKQWRGSRVVICELHCGRILPRKIWAVVGFVVCLWREFAYSSYWQLTRNNIHRYLVWNNANLAKKKFYSLLQTNSCIKSAILAERFPRVAEMGSFCLLRHFWHHHATAEWPLISVDPPLWGHVKVTKSVIVYVSRNLCSLHNTLSKEQTL